MALADQIHWSFQYDGRSQAPLFGKRLIEIMQDATVAELTDESAVVDRYLVLPNYWKGYRGRRLEVDDSNIEIGEAVVDRKQVDSANWQYDVRFLNKTSGEDLRLNFECLDNAFCTLAENWNVSVVNGANQGYKNFACDGKLITRGEHQQITLTVNGVDLPSGRFNGADPVTCNWSLFPENFEYDERETVLHQVCRRIEDCLIHWPIMKATKTWGENQWRTFIWSHHRFVEKVDGEIGLILTALEQSGLADNTLIKRVCRKVWE